MPSIRQRLVAFSLIGSLALPACSDPAATPPPSLSEGTPQRVVVIGPSSAETLVWLGLEHCIVGVSDYCVDPALQDRPRIGGQLDPNLERIATLQPDLVVVQGAHPKVEAWCAAQAVRYLPMKTQSVDDFLAEARTYGELFDWQGTDAQLELWLESMLGPPPPPLEHEPPQPRVLILASRDAERIARVLAVGSGSFLHELLEYAGGVNVFADQPRDYFDLAEETLHTLAPDLILELGLPQDDAQRLALWQRDFPDLPAVRNGQVYGLTEDFVFLPGPRMHRTLQLLREKLSLLK